VAGEEKVRLEAVAGVEGAGRELVEGEGETGAEEEVTVADSRLVDREVGLEDGGDVVRSSFFTRLS